MSVNCPEWLYKRKRGKSFPLGKAFVCDGNRGMSMSEDDGCPTAHQDEARWHNDEDNSSGGR